MRVLKTLHVWALSVVLFLPISLHAQSSDRDRDPALTQAKRLATEIQSANFHWGPFYLLSQFQVSDVGYGYEYYLPTGEDEEGGSKGVSISFAAPQKFFFIPRKKLIFTAEVTPAYSYFLGGSGGQFDYDARADAHLLLNHAYVNFHVVGADKLRPQAADFNRLATVKTSGFGSNSEIKFSSRTSLLLTGSALQTRYPRGDRYQPQFVPVDLLERDELSARAALHHKTFPLTSFRLAMEVADYDFSNASFKNAKRWRVSPGFDYDGSRVDIRFEAGPTRLTHADPSQKDYSGVTGGLGITRAVGRWSTSVGANRDFGFSIMEANNYFVSDKATAGLAYGVTSRLDLRASLTGERDDYPVEVRGIKRLDEITFSTVGFRYSRWKVSGGIDVGYYTRTSTLGPDDESGIRYVIDLSFTP